MIFNQIVAGNGSGSGDDTSDATAYAEHILLGYTAYARGSKLTGTYVSQMNAMLFRYTGDVQTITLTPGTYALHVYGGKGGYRTDQLMGGPGGYAYGELTLTESTLLYIRIGGAGNNGGFNGGGSRQGTYSTKMGGGASDIRIGVDSLYARVIVAGGGGSDGASNKPGKAGGGLEGIYANENYGSGGQGGTQTAPGAGSGELTPGLFGQGGTGIASGGGFGGAGGGGWFGGAGSRPDSSGDDDRGGGGGSGYVFTATSFKPTGFLLDPKYYLTNTILATGANGAGDGFIFIKMI